MTRPGIEPWSTGPLVNTLFIRPLVRHSFVAILTVLTSEIPTFLPTFLTRVQKLQFVVEYFLETIWRGRSRSVVVNVLNCNIVVREFELQWRYHVHCRTDTIWKDMNLVITPATN